MVGYIDKMKLFKDFSSLVEVYTNQLKTEIRETKPDDRNIEALNIRIDEAVKAKSHVLYMDIEDVAPVIHAKWVKKEVGVNEFLCSNCGRIEVSKTTIDNWNKELRCYNQPDKKYCCDCGAKMDLH